MFLTYSGSRRNLIRYNSPQPWASCEQLWLCVNIAWLEVFAHEKPACALSMSNKRAFEADLFMWFSIIYQPIGYILVFVDHQVEGCGWAGKKKSGGYPDLKNKEANKSKNPFERK